MTPQISILMYHQVGPFAPMTGHRSTYCHAKSFARQMSSLRLFGFRAISLDHALQGLRGERSLPRRSVVLTFDDGYQNFALHAFPSLQKHGFQSMVYLLSGLIGQKAGWFANEGRDTPFLLQKKEILNLRSQGVSFGSHGVSHVKLAEVDPEQAVEEIETSKQDLGHLLSEEIKHFCYPYGSYSPQVAQAVQRAGYRSAVTCLRAAATTDFSPYELPRKAISYGDSLLGFWWKIFFKNTPKSPPMVP